MVVGALVPNIVLAVDARVLFVAMRHPVGRLLDSDAVAEGMLWATPGLFCFALNKVLFGVVNGLRRMRAFAVYTSLRYLLIAVGSCSRACFDVAGDHSRYLDVHRGHAARRPRSSSCSRRSRCRAGAAGCGHARAHLDYGARGVLATLALEVNTKLDVWMLGVALPEAQVGIYALAAALYEGVLQLSVVVQNNLNPIIARDLAEGRRPRSSLLAQRSRRWFVPAAAGGVRARRGRLSLRDPVADRQSTTSSPARCRSRS